MSPVSLVTRGTESGAQVELQEYELLRGDWDADQRPVSFNTVGWELGEPAAPYRESPDATGPRRDAVAA